MSLVLDNLKKLKKKEDAGSIPPGMINPAPKRGGQRPSNVLLALLVFAVIGFAITLYLSRGTPKYAVTEPVRLNSIPDQTSAIAVKKSPASTEAYIQLADIAEQLPQSSSKVSAPHPETPSVRVKTTEISAKAAIQGTPEPKGGITDKDREEFRRKVSYNTMLTIADRAYAEGDYEKAITNYSEAMKQRPTQPNLLSLVRSKLGVGDVGSVPGLVSRYSYVTDAKGIAAISTAMSDAGYHSQAQELIADYKNDVENPSVLSYTSGLIYENSGKTIEAEQAYADAHREVPADAYYSYAYARAMDINKKYKQAAEQYTALLSMDADAEIKKNASSRAAVIKVYLKRLEEKAKANAEDGEIPDKE